jgi:hypothetical protein
MEKTGALIIVCLVFLASLGLPHAALAQEADFTVERFVVGRDVVALEPTGVAESFPLAVKRVYCFLDARDVARDTEVAMVWYHEGKERAMVTLLLRESDRWRTFSSKHLAGLRGNWEVVLQDAEGKALETASFTVK